MKPADPSILTINGGSLTITFALFVAGDGLRLILKGAVEWIGRPEASLRVEGIGKADTSSRPLGAPNPSVAVDSLMDWLESRTRGHPWPRWGITWCMAGPSSATRLESPRR